MGKNVNNGIDTWTTINRPKKEEEPMKNRKGITLISLVITIVVLVILSTVGIYLTLGNNGILNKAEQAKSETTKQAATEKMNLKITNMQIETYAEEQRMPTLQEFSDGLCEDNEIEYVELQSKKVGSLSKIEVGDAESIFTKLKEYPYEFEINSSLQLASIDGIKVATNNETITINKEEYEQLLKDVAELKANATNTIRFPDYNRLLTTITTQGASWTATEDCIVVGELKVRDGHGAVLCVDSIDVAHICNQSANSSSYTAIVVSEYVKAGSIVTTRENYGVYDLKVYALK